MNLEFLKIILFRNLYFLTVAIGIFLIICAIKNLFRRVTHEN
jgi:hypothetical protein